MTEQNILETIDFKANGQIDLNSIHKKRLDMLVNSGYVEEVCPQDGEPSFFILTFKGKQELYGEKG